MKDDIKEVILRMLETGHPWEIGNAEKVLVAEALAERVATTREIHNMICGDVPHSIDDCEHASEIVKALTKEYVILRRENDEEET